MRSWKLSWTLRDDMDEVMLHEADEGEERQALDSLRSSFIVLDRSTQVGGPGKGAFDYPAPGQ